MTGSDIEAMLQQAKLILYNEGKVAGNGLAVYQADNFSNALCQAIERIRTYGQTNVKQIVTCFVKMSEHNFKSVSGKEIVPFSFLDVSAEGQVLFDLKSEEATQFIDGLQNDYDKQLFLYMGIATNQYKLQSNEAE